MKVVRWMTAVAGAALVLSAQAPDRALGALGDAELILYRFPGVLDSGGPNLSGTATVFHCTNFSGATETVRIVIRDQGAAVVANFAISVDHLQTRTFATHVVAVYGHTFLNTGSITQGTAAIAATSTSIVCTAMNIDAASNSPVGIALHAVRFNPIPGTQE